MAYISSMSLDSIAQELQLIRELLERFFIIPVPPSPPERKLGKESISYLDETQQVELEEEELRQINRGIILLDQND